jgi:hypothetical protein
MRLSKATGAPFSRWHRNDDFSALSRATPVRRVGGIGTVFLEVTLANGQNYSVPIQDGHSLQQELDLFLNREGRYAGEWVPLQKSGRELFVRYENIVLVSPKTD